MDFKMVGQGEKAVAVVTGQEVRVSSPQDMLDLIATLGYGSGCSRIVLEKEALAEDFFDLKTGLAGEMLQKVINYRAAIAIVGDFSGYTSKALRDFMYESNQGNRIFFLPDEEAAVAKLQATSIS